MYTSDMLDERREKLAVTACHMRWTQDMNWADIADKLQIARSTLQKWRKSEWWGDIEDKARQTGDIQMLLLTARQTLVDVMQDKDARAYDRLEAAKFVAKQADPELRDKENDGRRTQSDVGEATRLLEAAADLSDKQLRALAQQDTDDDDVIDIE